MIVGVTGSRTFTDEQKIRAVLDAFAFGATSGHYETFTVRHGAASDGADEIADRWVRDWHVPELQVTADRWPAKWSEGRGAGFARNRQMVYAEPRVDMWLAFLDLCRKPSCPQRLQHTSHGATHCAELARDAGFPMRVFHLGDPQVFPLGMSADEAREMP